jgi:hypothetical protein
MLMPRPQALPGRGTPGSPASKAGYETGLMAPTELIRLAIQVWSAQAPSG